MILCPYSVGMRGNQYLPWSTKRRPCFPWKARLAGNGGLRQGSTPGERRRIPPSDERHRPQLVSGTANPTCANEALARQASDVMNLQELMLSPMPLVFATVVAASDAHGQVPRDCGGSREVSGEVARVIDGRSFLLADGREIRLAAIETLLLVPGDEDEARVEAARAAKQALGTLLLHREVDLAVTGGADRYGRLVAFGFVRASAGEALVQHELVATGHALVSPSFPFPAAMCRIYLRN